jgi:choline dehydrogenase-like flavoprotein
MLGATGFGDWNAGGRPQTGSGLPGSPEGGYKLRVRLANAGLSILGLRCMDIESLDSYPPDFGFQADVVIVGGGPAGLTIALEFANSETQVLVLESGLETQDPAHQDLARLESIGEPRSEASLRYRKEHHWPTFDHEAQPYGWTYRVLGGAGTAWSGKSALFDSTDFVKRDWVPNSGWPISRESLEPYFNRAAEILGLGPNLYDERLWDMIGPKFKRPPIDKSKLRSFFWQFSRSRLDPLRITNFIDEFKATSSANIRTLTNATVVHIDADAEGKRFDGLEVSTIEGARSHVKAKLCVLAAGGIENARLLLNSNRQQPSGLGNQNDVIGRYLMDHPYARIGYFKKEDIKAAEFLGFVAVPHKREMIMGTHGLSLSPEIQAREKLLNTAIFVWPEIAPDDPIYALRRLAKFQSNNLLMDLLSLLRNVGLLFKGIGLKIFYKLCPKFLQSLVVNFVMTINPNFIVREFESKGVPHKVERMAVFAMTEQEPDPESRFTLSDQKDVLGLPRIKACWKISEADRRSVVRAGQILLEELRKAGLPAPILEDWIVADRPSDVPLIDVGHMIGTTRMSDNPKTGVVDTRCQVHGVRGLYIAGGSVFPTSSHVNPTLTIISLAIRTADQLKRDLAEAGR